MGRLFGTDGARGIANKELTCELAMNIGRAAVAFVAGVGRFADGTVTADNRNSVTCTGS